MGRAATIRHGALTGGGWRLALRLVGAAALGLAAAHALAPPARAPAAAPPALAAPTTWAPAVPRGLALTAPGLDPAVPSARAAADGRREDALDVGRPGGPGPHLVIAVASGPGAGRAPSLLVSVARLGAPRGLAAAPAGPGGLVITRHGPLEVAPVTLAAASGEPVPCLAFRSVPGAAGAPVPLALAGWACPLPHDAARAPMEPAALACLIDRLVLPDGTRAPAAPTACPSPPLASPEPRAERPLPRPERQRRAEARAGR